MFGYETSEVLGQSLEIIMPDEFRFRHQAALEATARAQAKSKSKSNNPKRYNKIYEVESIRCFPRERSVDFTPVHYVMFAVLFLSSV